MGRPGSVLCIYMGTGVVMGVTVQPADSGDATTMIDTWITAAGQVEAVLPEGEGIREVVADKGYPGTERLVDPERLGVRSAEN